MRSILKVYVVNLTYSLMRCVNTVVNTYNTYILKPLNDIYQTTLGDAIIEVKQYDTRKLATKNVLSIKWCDVIITGIYCKVFKAKPEDVFEFSKSMSLDEDPDMLYEIHYNKDHKHHVALVKGCKVFDLSDTITTLKKNKYLYFSIGKLDYTNYIKNVSRLDKVTVKDLHALAYLRTKKQEDLHKLYSSVYTDGFSITTFDNDTLDEQILKDSTLVS